MTITSYDLAGPDPAPMTKEEVSFLKDVLQFLPEDPIIVQIGAERGCSTLAMLEERPDAFIFSIDIGERPQERKNIERAGLDPTPVVRGLGRSQQIGERWPLFWEFDMLYIDGDHREEPVYNDIRLWAPRVLEPGIIALHDYIEPPIPAHIHGRVYHAVERHRQPGGILEGLVTRRVERLIIFAKE